MGKVHYSHCPCGSVSFYITRVVDKHVEMTCDPCGQEVIFLPKGGCECHKDGETFPTVVVEQPDRGIEKRRRIWEKMMSCSEPKVAMRLLLTMETPSTLKRLGKVVGKEKVEKLIVGMEVKNP